MACRNLLLVALIALAGCWAGRGGDDSSSSTSTARRTGVTCLDFAYQDDAQAYFRTDPGARQLDSDGDGIACEELGPRPKSVAAPVRAAEQGVWAGDAFAMLLRASGAFWAIRTDEDGPADVFAGIGRSSSGSFSAEEVKRYRLQPGVVTRAALSATVRSGESLNGSITELTSTDSLNFTTRFVAAAVPDAQAGYRGTIRTLQGRHEASLTNDSGAACTFFGTFAAEDGESALRFTLARVAPACPGIVRDLADGLAFVDPASRRIHIVAAVREGADVTVFVGVQQ